MRAAIASAGSCAFVLLVACAGSNPAPVQPYSSDEPTPAVSSSVDVHAVSASSAPAVPPAQDARVEECENLSKTINSNGDSFKDGFSKASDPKAPKGAWTDLAAIVEEAGGKVRELGLKDKRLKSLAQEYSGLMGELAGLLRQTDTDFKKKDKAALKKDVGEIGKVEAREADLTGRINAVCNP